MAAAVEHFRPIADVIDLGGAPTIEGAVTGSGVGHFKQGWTRLSRPNDLCGKVYDREAYVALSAQHDTSWFPAIDLVNSHFVACRLRVQDSVPPIRSHSIKPSFRRVNSFSAFSLRYSRHMQPL